MYDTTRLKALGTKRKRLMDQVEALRTELDPEVRAAKLGGVRPKDIETMTGMSKEMVRLAAMSEEDRQAEREKRRKP